MASFGSGFDNLVNGLYQGLTDGNELKDFRHASKTFLSDGYALAPQTKYLFHVYFTLNTNQIPALQSAFGSTRDIGTIGMLVKTADLPKYNIDVSEHNQYNRKRYVQNKINYQPVNITFHDDGSDIIRSMWNAYYTYYFSDSLHGYDNMGGQSLNSSSTSPLDFNRRDIYDNLRSVNDWGYSSSSPAGNYKPNFFKDIKIYGLNKGNFVQYTLINPIITDWAHDTFDYSAGNGTMGNSVTLRYETVKYSRGKVGNEGNTEVRGFMDPTKYDLEPSQLSRPGATTSILGQAGLVDAVSSINNDLANGNIIGAGLTALTTYDTFKDAPLGDMLKSEATSVVSGIATNTASSFVFPTALTANPNVSSAYNNTVNAGQEYVSRATLATDVNSNGSTVNIPWIDPDTGNTY